MSKKSGFLARMEQQKKRELIETHRFTRQLMVDLAYVALNNEFGFGSDRLKRFAAALLKVYEEYADLWNGDTPDTEYAQAKLDAKLQQIFAGDFQIWEDRYS